MALPAAGRDPGAPLPRPRAWRGLRTALRRRRRLVAALLLAAACGTAVEALADDGAGPVQDVAVAVRDLPAGHALDAGDLDVLAVPVGLAPDGAMTPEQARAATAGRAVVAAAVRSGEMLTDARLAGPGLLAGAPAGSVAVAVPLTGAATAGLVSAGDAVRVLAAGSPDVAGLPTGEVDVVVDRATVLSRTDSGDGGLLGGGSGGAAVVLAVTATQAQALAGALAAGGGAGLTLALLP